MSCFKGGIDICYPPRPFRGEAVSNDGSNWIASIDSVDTFKNFIKIFPLKITFMGFLFLVALTSCDDENNLLVTEKEIKQTNSRLQSM